MSKLDELNNDLEALITRCKANDVKIRSLREFEYDEKKLAITCSDLHGLDQNIVCTAMSIENFLIGAGATSEEYTRMDLLNIAVKMKIAGYLEDLDTDLIMIRNELKKLNGNGRKEESRELGNGD